jgi:cold shock protein
MLYSKESNFITPILYLFKLSKHTTNQMMKGTIKKIMDKGFGFITPENGGKDIFFHSNSLLNVQFNDLREGDNVTFEVEDGPKGPSAINVERV